MHDMDTWIDGGVAGSRQRGSFNPKARWKPRAASNQFLAEYFDVTRNTIGRWAGEFGYNPYDVGSLLSFAIWISKTHPPKTG